MSKPYPKLYESSSSSVGAERSLRTGPGMPVIRAIEHELVRFGARPDRGKPFATDRPTLDGRYERMGDFRLLAAELDPGG